MKARMMGVALELTLALAPAALAVPQGKWTQVTVGGEQSSISNIGVVRTGDGLLHVVWQRKSGSAYDLLHTGISASGNVGSPVAIVSGWNGVGDADLVVGGGGELQAFWAGNRTTDTFEPSSASTSPRARTGAEPGLSRPPRSSPGTSPTAERRASSS